MREKIFNALPFILLVSGLLITLLFFRNEMHWNELSQQDFYKDQLDKVKQNIAYRLQTYVDEQIAAGAFIASSEEVTRNEWRDFVVALQLDVNYPGINGLGLAVPVKKSDSLAFVQSARRDKAPDFVISSLGQVPDAEDFFVIKYLEPYLRNRKAVGFDMGSEPKRRNAMEEARNSGKPTITERVVLVQDNDKTPGFLIYVPIYRPRIETDSAQRKFLGWAYSPFIARNFMRAVLGREINRIQPRYFVELYYGEKTDSSSLLYHSWDKRRPLTDSAFTTTFPVYGNKWTLRLLPSPEYEVAKGKTLAYVILFGGIMLNISLFFLLRALANTRKNAIHMASSMTQELRELNQNLDKKVAERTQELASKNKQLSNIAENLKNAYEDLEVKVKFRNLQLEKQVKALQEEISKLKNSNN